MICEVYRIDRQDGEYYTLTKDELYSKFSESELQEFKDDEDTIFIETIFTIKQLIEARKLFNNKRFIFNYESDHGCKPEVYDLLYYLY